MEDLAMLAEAFSLIKEFMGGQICWGARHLLNRDITSHLAADPQSP